MARPIGVTIIAVLAAINGITDLVAAGSAFAKFDLPGFGGFADTLAVVGLFLIGFVWVFAAWGFWTAAFWARILGLIWSALGLAAAGFAALAFLPVLGQVIVPIIVSAIVPLVMFWYLRRPEIRRWFEMS